MSENEFKKEYGEAVFTGDENQWMEETTRSFGWRLQRRTPHWRPPTDVYETEKDFVVVVEIAGMRGLEINATYDNGVLSIRGARSDKGELKAYHQMEIAYGDFETKIRIPGRIEADQIDASYSDGFLRVVLPKMEPKEIPIEE
ncbi:MAG: Hsp20 family protein [Anaerolineales bacterium]|nr:Hsp20 family protein [Anaerolineales bacterium]